MNYFTNLRKISPRRCFFGYWNYINTVSIRLIPISPASTVTIPKISYSTYCSSRHPICLLKIRITFFAKHTPKMSISTQWRVCFFWQSCPNPIWYIIPIASIDVASQITILLSGVELSEDSYCRIMEDVLQFEYGKSESKRRLTLLTEGLTLRTKERRDCQCMLHTGS